MRQLGLAPTEYRDPQAGGHARDETGADVIALIGGRCVGIQATDLDIGDLPGAARRVETKLARAAERRGTTYATWPVNGGPNPRKDGGGLLVTRHGCPG
jgi:hypothetical protein